MAESLRRSWRVLAALGGALGLVAVVHLSQGAGRAIPAEKVVREHRGEPDGAASAMPAPPGVLRFASTGNGLAIPVATDAGGGSPAPGAGIPMLQYPTEWHEFYFTRAAYSSWGRGRGGRGQSWAIDYPKADIQFLTVLKRLTNLDAYDDENAIPLTNERIRHFPFLYALEVGYMNMSPPEVEGLRDYLLAGGFLVIDDFWGTQEWAQFEYQMGLVFPGRPIIDLELDHPVFNTFYEIDEILQVPAYGRFWGGQTSERDGYVPYVKGIEDDDGRLMVIINWNTDLGDAWEWAEQPDYPLQYSTFAFQMGVNMIVYAMSH